MKAIVKTLPFRFFREVTARQFIREFVQGLNDDEESSWLFPMQGVPKQDVLHVYLVIGNRIRYRANIVGFEPGGEVTFDDGRSMEARCWMRVSGPVVRAPYRIERRGFQGFRYCEQYF